MNINSHKDVCLLKKIGIFRRCHPVYNLDQLLSYLVFITVITFIFERVIENLLIPFFPVLEAKLALNAHTGDLSSSRTHVREPAREVAVTGARPSRRTLVLLLLMFGIGFGLALANPRFRFFAGGLGMPTVPILDCLFTAALIAGGSQPLHSLVEKVRRK
jgi:hypothetical protein